ncbi:hypothetical protein VIBR0546_19117, partial [Vibrio brasiliensis LMG 20546]
RSEKREARSEKREARSEKREDFGRVGSTRQPFSFKFRQLDQVISQHCLQHSTQSPQAPLERAKPGLEAKRSNISQDEVRSRSEAL